MLKLKKSALCPQRVLQRFLWITEEEAIGVFFFIITTVCVACTIRTEYVNRIQANFRSKFIPCDIYGEQKLLWTDSPFPSTSVFSCQYYSIAAPWSSSSYQDKHSKPGNLPKPTLFRKSGSIGETNTFIFFFFFKNASFVYSTSVINIYQS